MKSKNLIMLSLIIDKMEIKEELKNIEITTGNKEKDNEAVAKEVIALILTRIHKCEEEFYSFIASYKGYLPNKADYEYDPELDENYSADTEKEKTLNANREYKKALKEALRKAEDEDIVAVFKEISKIDGVMSFLAQA